MDYYECNHGVMECAGAEAYASRKKIWTFVTDVKNIQFPIEFNDETFTNQVDFDYSYDPGEFDEINFAWKDREGTIWMFCVGCHYDKMAKVHPVIQEEEDDLPADYYLDLVAA